MIDTNVVQIAIYHHCIEGSKVVVPKKYVVLYHLDKFESCQFQSDIKVAVNGDPVLDTIITKAQFTEAMEPHIQQYATLLAPYLYLNKEYKLELHYSLSIPLTDLGISLEKQFQLKH
ncbi:hypothetical protein ACE38W_15160 [Chitinophaga sp. Hz27]|uniref:hypothetical protein n=1 Tax=Chitinophaga sp. Hz27 TaxID=3347169 RepID=UPI0035E25F88